MRAQENLARAATASPTRPDTPAGALARNLLLKKHSEAVSCTQKMSTLAPAKKKYARVSLEAADLLLKAVKEKLLRENGKIDYAALRDSGYSDAMIARLKQI